MPGLLFSKILCYYSLKYTSFIVYMELKYCCPVLRALCTASLRDFPVRRSCTCCAAVRSDSGSRTTLGLGIRVRDLKKPHFFGLYYPYIPYSRRATIGYLVYKFRITPHDVGLKCFPDKLWAKTSLVT